MTLLGINVRHPSLRKMIVLCLCIIFMSVAMIGLTSDGMIPVDLAWLAVIGGSTGMCLGAFGISVADNGWRGFALMTMFSIPIWLIFNFVGFI